MAMSTKSVRKTGIQIHQVLVSGSFGSEDSGFIGVLLDCNTSPAQRQKAEVLAEILE
jgi:hypothetical protein